MRNSHNSGEHLILYFFGCEMAVRELVIWCNGSCFFFLNLVSCSPSEFAGSSDSIVP